MQTIREQDGPPAGRKTGRRAGAKVKLGPAAWYVALYIVVITASIGAVLYMRFGLTLAEAGLVSLGLFMVLVLAELYTSRQRERVALEGRLAELAEDNAAMRQQFAAIHERIADSEAPLSLRVDDMMEERLSPISSDIRELETLIRGLSDKITEVEHSVPAAPGEAILPADFIPVAERSDLMASIDGAVVLRCTHILRRMIQRNRDVAVFCNLSAQTLADSAFFGQLREFAEANRSLAGSLIFELSQEAFNGIGPVEQASLDALAEFGIRLSLDHVTDFNLDPTALAERHVRFVKIDANDLLEEDAGSSGNVHIADLGLLLARSGIDLVASRVEIEVQVVNLLDFEVAYAQGYLFSTPRPVRADLQGDEGIQTLAAAS